MKKFNRLLTLILSMLCVFSLVSAVACAENTSEAEEATQKRYDVMCSFAAEYYEDLTLPEYEDMVVTEKSEILFVQSKYGIAKAQKMFDAPDGNECARVRDLSRVMVLARKGDYSFVILMEDVDGTMGWIENAYLTENWNYNLCHGRTTNNWPEFEEKEYVCLS